MDEENGRVKKNASFLDLLKNDSQGAFWRWGRGCRSGW